MDREWHRPPDARSVHGYGKDCPQISQIDADCFSKMSHWGRSRNESAQSLAINLSLHRGFSTPSSAEICGQTDATLYDAPKPSRGRLQIEKPVFQSQNGAVQFGILR